MLSLVPFDIDTIDSGLRDSGPSGAGANEDGADGVKGVVAPVAGVGERQADLVGTILALGMRHLGDAGPTRFGRPTSVQDDALEGGCDCCAVASVLLG